MTECEEVPLVEAAQRLRLSYAQAMRWILTGRLSARRVRGRWRVSVESVERAQEHAKRIIACERALGGIA